MSMPIPINPMTQTPKGLRVHIGLFGRRNVGKSSLVNALANQKISIVSDVPGTTTDPVEKAAELAPIGPVVYIDTAGIDDVGKLGEQRNERSLSVLGWMDIALIVTDHTTLDKHETALVETARKNQTPAIIVVNKIDSIDQKPENLNDLNTYGIPVVCISAQNNIGIDELRKAIIQLHSEKNEPDRPMMQGMISPGDTVVLVTPIDTGAPKGRMIMPQVQAIREILDSDAKCIVVRENRVSEAIANEKTPPKFVMTDSQVVLKISKAIPEEIPLTTFSIQMADCKSDLIEMARGAAMLEFLKPGDKVMVCETCSHHPQADDIGRKKIPRWLAQKIGGELDIDVVVGKDFPTDLTPYKLILQCGGCVVTRRHMISRLQAAIRQDVPMTNYGVAISYLQGVLERALELHPDAMKAYQQAREYYRKKYTEA